MLPGSGRYVDGSATESAYVRRVTPYTKTMLPPSTLTLTLANGVFAGLSGVGAPVATVKALPWHGHEMKPFWTASTWQPWWVHLELNPMNSPALGCVTTTRASEKICPPPTATPLVGPSTVGPGDVASEGLAPESVGLDEADEPQAAITRPVAPRTAAPAIKLRRLNPSGRSSIGSASSAPGKGS